MSGDSLLSAAVAANATFQPPLLFEEVVSVVESVSRTHKNQSLLLREGTPPYGGSKPSVNTKVNASSPGGDGDDAFTFAFTSMTPKTPDSGVNAKVNANPMVYAGMVYPLDHLPPNEPIDWLWEGYLAKGYGQWAKGKGQWAIGDRQQY